VETAKVETVMVETVMELAEQAARDRPGMRHLSA
jgi:hypothetical protein